MPLIKVAHLTNEASSFEGDSTRLTVPTKGNREPFVFYRTISTI